MDNHPEMIFNNQVLNPPINRTVQQSVESQPQNAIVVYGQGKHQELLDQIQHENLQSIKEILESVNNADQLINILDLTFKQSAFYKAVNIPSEKMCLDIAQYFFSKGGKINVKDIHGQSPVFYICKEGKIELLKICLAHGIDINETDNFRQTPLFYAARDGKADMVRFMIQSRANPNHKDKVDQTPLFYASRDNRLECVKALIDLGADVNIADHKKQTALFFARKNTNKDIDEYLIMNGAINTKDGILRQSDLKKGTKIRKLKSSKSQINWTIIRNKCQTRKKISRSH